MVQDLGIDEVGKVGGVLDIGISVPNKRREKKNQVLRKLIGGRVEKRYDWA